MTHCFGKNNTVELVVNFQTFCFNKLLGVHLKLIENKSHLAIGICIGVGRLGFREALQVAPQGTTSHSAEFTAVSNHQEKKKEKESANCDTDRNRIYFKRG